MNNKKLIFVVVLILTLVNCKGSVNFDLYVDDLRIVQKRATAQKSPYTMSIEMPSKKQCIEKSDKITSILKNYSKNIEKLGCEDRGFNNYLNIQDSFEIQRYSNESTYKGLFGVFIADDQRIYLCGSSNITLAINQVKAELGGLASLDYGDIAIGFTITNGGVNTETFITGYSIVDGKPVDTIELSLPKRKKVHIVRNNVFSRIVLEGRCGVVGLLTKQPG